MPTEDLLAYRDKVFINFRNSTFQWVDIKLFSLPDVPDDAALSLLLRHVRYRDSYAGTDDTDMVTLHGPYQLDVITVDSFTATDPSVEESVLRAWADEHATLPDVPREDLERELYPRMRRASGCYRLKDLGERAFHEWGAVLGMSGFHELVLVDRAAGELALVVASDD